MQYLGGKARIAVSLSVYLKSRLEGREFVEPFCGALNVTARMEGRRVACDASPHLMSLYRELRKGWTPPDQLTEEEWLLLRERMDPTDPMTAFAGYGCSYGGKFFAGYARGSPGRSYASNARGSLLKKFSRCGEVVFACRDYQSLNPGRAFLVYCDPPYAETTGYAAVGAFDSGAFWETARRWARAGVGRSGV